MRAANASARPGVSLRAPLDPASLVAFRVLFGLVMCAGSIRFLANGWVQQAFIEPDFHFKYWGFEWVRVLPEPAMVGAFVALAVLALMIAAGLFYRVATVLFFLLFTYVELIDVTYYLNHYYLVSLLAFLLCVLPLHRAGSVDAWLRPTIRQTTFPAWMTYLLRFQVGTVYVYAGLAKLGSDWLLYGQPLQIWMSARTDTPIIGPWLDLPWVALAMSWAGFLNDTLVVPFLLWRRSRPYAYAAVVVFHALTGVFFNIGMFPFIMIVAATVFFAPDWPRRRLARFLSARLAVSSADEPERTRTSGSAERGRKGAAVRGARALGFGALALYCALQVLVPLRGVLYGGNVQWHEQGIRWSWRVKVREKNGSVTYRVRAPETGREWQVPPSNYLTPYQERQMSRQPDLILQLAHRIAEDFRARGTGDVEVRADTLVSLNGRPARPLIDPDVDLSRVRDGLAQASWILPAPEEAPIELRPAGRFARREAGAR